jgi:hypothetical protein
MTTTAPKPAPAPAVPAPNVRGTLVGSPAAAFVLFSRPAKPTVRVRVSGGAFAVHLAPGVYTIRLAPPGSGRVTPASVRVPRTGIVRLRLVVQPKP